MRALFVFAALLAFIAATPAEARHRHHRHHAQHASLGPTGCVFDNNGHQTCGGAPDGFYSSPVRAVSPGRREIASHERSRGDVKYIPNPPGTWRVSLSCAHRLAAYWGLGKGLDSVSTWAHRFKRVAGPCVGCAAIRRGQGHIMGIIGGGPGEWVVADFNSGRHLNREYTVSHFGAYFFVDPHSG